MRQARGFTLIELLIVIGILAVLATLTVLVINPAQLFAQARDSQRMSDLGTLRRAIDLFILYGPDASRGDLDGNGGTFACLTNFGSSASTVGNANKMFTGSLTIDTTGRGIFAIDGSGWVPIVMTDLASVGVQTPITKLPADPVNNTTYNYQYACNQFNVKYFELNANLESNKYVSKETTDGGNSNNFYEVGNDPGLDL